MGCNMDLAVDLLCILENGFYSGLWGVDSVGAGCRGGFCCGFSKRGFLRVDSGELIPRGWNGRDGFWCGFLGCKLCGGFWRVDSR